MRRLVPALLSVLLAAPCALAAQDATQAWLLKPGARVRVAYAGQDARTGTLLSVASDTLIVQWTNGAGPARMARTRVTRLDVSRGIRPGQKASRAAIGFAVGGGLGFLIGEVSSRGSSDELGSDLATIFGAALLGGVGAAVGAISGRAKEEWEDVRLTPPRMGVVVPARGRGTGIGLALAF